VLLKSKKKSGRRSLKPIASKIKKLSQFRKSMQAFMLIHFIYAVFRQNRDTYQKICAIKANCVHFIKVRISIKIII